MKLKRRLYSSYVLSSKLNKAADKYNYLFKLGTRQIIGPSSKELNPRFGKTVKVSDIIVGAGKFAYKKGKRI